MDKDQKLLEKAYVRIYESASFEDPRLTNLENDFVNEVVEAVVDGYPTTVQFDGKYSPSAFNLIKSTAEKIFQKNVNVMIPFIRAANKIIGSWNSNFNQMHQANLIPSDKKGIEEMKKSFKRYIASTIVEIFDSDTLPWTMKPYIKQRKNQLLIEPIDKRLPELKGIFEGKDKPV